MDWKGACFLFNSQFYGLETSCSRVVSEKRMWGVVTLKAGENCKSKPPTGYIEGR